MSEITIDDIYALFKASQAELKEELRLSRAESERLAAERAAEAERRAAEAERITAERAAEYDRQIAEAKRLAAERAAEYDRQIAEAKRLAAERAAQDERRAAERAAEEERRAIEEERRAIEEERRRLAAEKSMEELRRTVAQTSREVANLTTRWGRFVEELVRPAVIRLFQGRGIDIKQTSLHVESKIVRMEIDVLGVDGDCVVAVECKSRLSQDDVDEMCQRLSKFKLAFPQYANYQIYGAVAGIEINETVDIYAYRKGLYVIRTSGDSVEIANDEKFQPTAW